MIYHPEFEVYASSVYGRYSAVTGSDLFKDLGEDFSISILKDHYNAWISQDESVRLLFERSMNILKLRLRNDAKLSEAIS